MIDQRKKGGMTICLAPVKSGDPIKNNKKVNQLGRKNVGFGAK